MTSDHSMPYFNTIFTKEELKSLIVNEKFSGVDVIKGSGLQTKDFEESEHWFRIKGRYISKELAILGWAQITWNIQNRDTTPMKFIYLTGDVIEVDLGVKLSPKRIETINEYLWKNVQILPTEVRGEKEEKIRNDFRDLYRAFIHEKSNQTDKEVLKNLIQDAGGLRNMCFDKVPDYLKKENNKLWEKGI